MQLYPHIPVTLHVQSYGSVFMMILKGNEANIQTVFNALYNFGATNEGSNCQPIEPNFTDEYNTIAYFWSSPQKMETFFKTLYFVRNRIDIEDRLHRKNNNWKRIQGGLKSELGQKIQAEFEQALANAQDVFAKEQINLLIKGSSISFNPNKQTGNFMSFGQGIISSERPDDDFKDSVLRHAFSDGKDSNRSVVNDTENA